MRRGSIACVVVALALGARPSSAGQSCESLAGLVLEETTITSAGVVPAGTHCRVAGVVAPSNGFEVWLPTSGWNGKLQGVGNGALGGYVNYFGMNPALARGYATFGSDGGRRGSPFDGSWALGRPDLVIDFGYRSVHVTTVAAKAIVQAFYGVPPARSYFVGCSTGGRQGLMEAQRYPEDYDGFVVGAAANPLTRVAMTGNWILQALHEDPATIVPDDVLPRIAAAVLARCDARDGVSDGLLEDPRRCRFDPRTLRCPRGTSGPGDCLTAAQTKALKRAYAGPRTSRGRRLFPGYSPGGEIGAGSDFGPAGEPALSGWEGWIVGEALGAHHPIQDGFFKFLAFEDPSWDWRTFDFDRDPRTVEDKVGAIVDAVDPDLSALRARGGKIVMYHGWSDPAIPALASVRYYERVRAAMGRRATADFFRLFMAPGMQHCAGGPGPNAFDAVGALERWVEDGVAPDAIVATHRTDGIVDRTRPLCPYPQVARWDGTGDPDDAASFTCGRTRR
jgi:feruloyl esterase